MQTDSLILDAEQVAALRFDDPALDPDPVMPYRARRARAIAALDAAGDAMVGCEAMTAPAPPSDDVPWREFASRRDGMIHAMDGGLWLHRHVWYGRSMAHLVSTDRERLLAYGRTAGIPADRLQYKPLKDPRTGLRRDAWHWDLVGRFLPRQAEG